MKKLLSLFIAIVMTAAFVAVLPVSSASIFSDVQSDRWSASSIFYAVNSGYMKGVGGDKFDPAGSLTRAMVATVLWRRENSPAPSAPSGFDDVPAGEWYADAVAWAKEAGVVQGVSDKEFNPNGLITREQLATMLFRFSSSAPVSVPERADLSPFADSGKVSDWATEPLEWAVESGLIKGTDGGKLAPGGFATREQFAAIIERFDKTFKLKYNEPVVRSHYTEKDYGLADDADFFVSPSGSDGNDGSFDRPFATWNKAAEAVRELKKTKTGDITVAFMAGTYDSLSVILTEEDSGSPDQRITYRAYGDGDPVFEGGTVFSADDFSDLNAEEAARFSKNVASKIKKIDLGSMIRDTSSFRIYSDDGILIPARYPNRYDDGTDQLFVTATTTSDFTMKITMKTMKDRLDKKYKDLTGLQIYGFLTYGWHKETLSVSDYDPETGIFTVPDASSSEYAKLSGAPGLRYGVEENGVIWSKEDVMFAFLNMPEDLDARGEYLFDKETGTLYVYDPHGEYVIPQKTTSVKLIGADDITISGFSFIGSQDAPIRAASSSSFYLDNCKFRVTSGNEFVVVERAVKGVDFDFRLTNCDFESAPLYAVRVHPQQEGATRYDYPVSGFYDNNRFAKIGIGKDGGCALFIRDHESGTISHNEFEDCARYAISYGGCNNLTVEYNVFRRCMYNSDDGGVIYNGNDRTEYGNVVRFNIFYPTSWFGMYVDDGGVGVEAYGNIFYSMGPAMVTHEGRDNYLHDNVLIDTGVSVTHEIYSGLLNALDSGGSLTDEGTSWGEYYKKWVDYFAMLDANEEYKAIIQKERPEVFELSIDPEDVLKSNFVLAPHNVITNNLSVDTTAEQAEIRFEDFLKDYVVNEGNRAYGMNENPAFVNPTLGDYRIRSDADFPDIHFEDIGRY